MTWRAKYSTPLGERWLSVKADDERMATILAKNKTPWRAGWVFESVEPAKKPQA